MGSGYRKGSGASGGDHGRARQAPVPADTSTAASPGPAAVSTTTADTADPDSPTGTDTNDSDSADSAERNAASIPRNARATRSDCIPAASARARSAVRTAAAVA
ncbi:hypothetical protein VR45_35645, partial [Streptomyces sp. NRRL S-495]